MSTAERVLTGARWSEATRCPRMAAITLSGAIPEPPGPTLEGLYERGHDVQAAFVRRLQSEYSGPIITEFPIPWGNGHGWETHVDVLLPEADRAHVEVKSTQNLQHLPGCAVNVQGVDTTSAVLQVVGQAEFDPAGGTAEVVAKSPLDYLERSWKITLTDDLRGAARETAQIVVSAAQTGELPARVCRTPSDARGRQCPHATVCFEGWQAEDPIRLHGELIEVADRLAGLEAEVKQSDARTRALKADRDEVRAELRGWIAPGVAHRLGQVEVRVTEVKPRVTFDSTAAIAAGALTAERAAEFTNIGAPSERWHVDIIDEEGAP